MKDNKKILLGGVFVLATILGFYTGTKFLTLLAITGFSALIFFFDPAKITIGLTKLWCISIIISLFMIYGKASDIAYVLSALWLFTIGLAVYNLINNKNKSEG